MPTPYSPESYVDFSQPGPKAAMLAALEKVRGHLGRTFSLWIDGKPVTTSETFKSISPADSDRVVGVFAHPDDANQALIIAAAYVWNGRRPPPDAACSRSGPSATASSGAYR
jgi:hypothetical protein